MATQVIIVDFPNRDVFDEYTRSQLARVRIKVKHVSSDGCGDTLYSILPGTLASICRKKGLSRIADYCKKISQIRGRARSCLICLRSRHVEVVHNGSTITTQATATDTRANLQARNTTPSLPRVKQRKLRLPPGSRFDRSSMPYQTPMAA